MESNGAQAEGLVGLGRRRECTQSKCPVWLGWERGYPENDRAQSKASPRPRVRVRGTFPDCSFSPWST